MKRKFSQISVSPEDVNEIEQLSRQFKKRRLNDFHIQDNHDKIELLIKNQQKVIEDFSKTVKKLNEKIEKLENTVEKQQFILKDVIQPTTFKSSSPPSYIN